MPAGRGHGARLAKDVQSLALIVSLALVSVTVHASDSSHAALKWLKRMAEAARSLNYEGTFVYRQGSLLETLRIIHRADAHGEKERLVSLNGVAREVVRDESGVTCILPDHHSVVVARGRSGLLPNAFRNPDGDLEAYYVFSLGGEDRVAGRPVRVVDIKPRDEYRYGYRLWLDQETALLLKSELLDGDGVVLEQILYTSISLPSEIPDKALEPLTPGSDFTWHTAGDAQSATGDIQSEWRTDWLPMGFSLRHREQNPMPNRSAPVKHLLFSDGLASFSLYIERLTSETDHFQGPSRMGAMNAFGVIIEDYQITVVGEVPRVTVERVGRAVGQRR